MVGLKYSTYKVISRVKGIDCEVNTNDFCVAVWHLLDLKNDAFAGI